MTTPLMMLGPGGDYVTRFDVKGTALVRGQAGPVAGNDKDSDSAGNMSPWARLRRRRKQQDDVENSASATDSGTKTPADRFEHTVPLAPATYARPTPGQLHQRLALIQAAERWQEDQSAAIEQFAAGQTAIEHAIVEAQRDAQTGTRSSSDQPTVRLIRWNGATMRLPRPLPSPLPEHAFGQRSARAQAATNPESAEARELGPKSKTQPQPTLTPVASTDHDHPEPHPQTDEDPHDDPRLAALPWLFPDHAGTGRRARRVQGHGLRARRSAHQKGSPDPRCEQGALFGAVA